MTTLLRARMRHRTWRLVHLLSYAAWGVAVAHGLGIGTDLRSAGWERVAVWRLGRARSPGWPLDPARRQRPLAMPSEEAR